MTTKAPSKRRAKTTAVSIASESIQPRLPTCVVGIGASAGGLSAIRAFFEAMPADSGVAFVVIQHLAPTHVSMAAEIISKYTHMVVTEAENGLLLEANHVYTTPSDKDISIQNGQLHLSPRNNIHRSRFPIDTFLSSLGIDCGARAIGVIFSGTGSDGSMGVKAISAHGGAVLVQQPDTAEYDGMPLSAIATGVVNNILPVVQMPKIIGNYTKHPYVTRADELETVESGTSTVENLIAIIKSKRGYDFSGYKRGTLVRRIERRMGLHGILRHADYATLLKANPPEVDALFKDLLIGVTEFFRDAEAWQALKAQVITPLVASKAQDAPIRIWIPGCSTGEEAYTMAMVVLDHLRRVRKHCPVQIFATDTNAEALEIGRAGRYPMGIATRISPARVKRYFDESPDLHCYSVKDEVRRCVVFGIQNIFSDPPFGRVDLISCRNVLIYLEPEIQKRVLNIFHFALRKDAYLFLGSAEFNGGRDDLFQPLSKKFRLFHRVGKARVETLPSALPVPGTPGASGRDTPRAEPALSHLVNFAQRLILDRFSPASVMVNAINEAVYFCGPTDEFLVRPRGAPSHDLMLMVREGLRSRVRLALKEAAKTEMTVNVHGARMKHGGVFLPVQVTVIPNRGDDSGRYFLVVFRHDNQPILVPSDKGHDRDLILHLEEELEATHFDLQSSIDRFNITLEDLRASNEEVVSTNEELRSLNEELESSKEELQSLNEELSTVNQQLEAKVRELEVAINDQSNLLASSDVATICLDESLRIKWFAPATKKKFNFLTSDIGRPIGDMLHAIGDINLVLAAKAVMARQSVPDREFQVENGRWYLRRTLPYMDATRKICGVVATYTDITDSHLAIQAEKSVRGDLLESMGRTDKLRILSAAMVTAEERERRQLAQDLHDDLGQLLAIISLKAGMLSKQEMSESSREAVKECALSVEQANRKLRTIALQLNPPMLDTLGLVPAIQWLAEEVNRLHRLEVVIDDDGKVKHMDRAVSATLFRAVRELLINVTKHANVSRAEVVMRRDPANWLTVTVSDAGAGFKPETTTPSAESGGFGLINLHERINYLGGEMSVRSVPGDGTSVIIKVPLLADDVVPGKIQPKALS